MAAEPSKSLTKRSADNSLMPPPPPPKRIRRPATVLDEDTYTGALSHIIARDFFPGLLESEVQQEYLDAVESRDREWINEAGRKLTEVMTPGPEGRRKQGRRGVSMTPFPQAGDETPRGWGGDTPASVVQSEGTVGEREKTSDVNINLSLGSFQAKYTSEDNESFNELLDKQNAKRAEKYSWLYNGNKIPAARQIAYRERQAKLLEASKDNAAEKQIVVRAQNLDDRPAMPDIRQAEPRNAFMFTPDSIEETHTTTAQAAEEKSYAPPKAVVYNNTRLPTVTSTGDVPAPPSPSLSAVDAAIAGRQRPTASEPGYDGSETPRVRGYAFVDEEPTPAELGQKPSLSPEPEDDLLKRLGAKSDGSPNVFHLTPSSKREDLHHAMVERNSKNKRAPTMLNRLDALKAGQDAVGRTPTPKFLSATPRPGAGNLTPAAQSLLGRVGTPVRGEVMGSVFSSAKEKGRWTPKVQLTPRARREV